MSEGSSADNTIVEVEERNVGSDKLRRIETMKVTELKEQLEKRKLKVTGKKKELQDRLRAFVVLEMEHGKDEEDEDDEEDDEEDEDERRSVYETRTRMSSSRTPTLTFREVEESMNTFSGDDSCDIENWLQEFEEMSDLCEWTDVQRVIYAKRLLYGSARLFVNYEKCCTCWKTMKRMLSAEFTQKVDSHKVHKDLSRRIKKETETYVEYVYKMFYIAKQVNMESAAIIRYIIDGIQDEESNKIVLYGAKSIRELKEKFAIYEFMKENAKTRSRRSEEKLKKMDPGAAVKKAVRRCFLCGDKNHLSGSCPTKDKDFSEVLITDAVVEAREVEVLREQEACDSLNGHMSSEAKICEENVIPEPVDVDFQEKEEKSSCQEMNTALVTYVDEYQEEKEIQGTVPEVTEDKMDASEADDSDSRDEEYLDTWAEEIGSGKEDVNEEAKEFLVEESKIAMEEKCEDRVEESVEEKIPEKTQAQESSQAEALSTRERPEDLKINLEKKAKKRIAEIEAENRRTFHRKRKKPWTPDKNSVESDSSVSETSEGRCCYQDGRV